MVSGLGLGLLYYTRIRNQMIFRSRGSVEAILIFRTIYGLGQQVYTLWLAVVQFVYSTT